MEKDKIGSIRSALEILAANAPALSTQEVCRAFCSYLACVEDEPVFKAETAEGLVANLQRLLYGYVACTEGCRGYAAFEVNRRPREGLEYVTRDGAILEIEACEDCGRFKGESRDELAHRRWRLDGRPPLHPDE